MEKSFLTQCMIARFTGYNSHTTGRPVLDSTGYTGQVFLARDSQFAPKARELWQCETLRIGEIADDVHFNAGVVRPLRKLDSELEPYLDLVNREHGLLDRGHRVCYLGRQVRRAILAEPELLQVLADVLSEMDVSKMALRGGVEPVSVNLGRNFAMKTCTGTFPIHKDSTTLFSYLRGFTHPVRIIEKKLEPTSVLRFGINFSGPGRWHGAPNKTWGIQWISAGDIGLQPEPTEIHKASQLRYALDFWKHTARYYRQEMMSVPFDSTWTEILEASRRDAIETRPDSEPPEPHHTRPTPDAQVERDGALLVD